jgi:hypothetical protein
MKPSTLIWGAADWLAIAATIAAVLLLILLWGYWRAGAARRVRVLAGTLKAIGILILVSCLLEPLISGTRARPGANVFVLLADNSQSMTLRDQKTQRTRGEELKALAPKTAPWLAQIREDFDLHQYGFDTQLRSLTAGVEELDFTGPASHLGNTLERLARRYHGRPLSGVLLFTDGSATDAEALERLVVRKDTNTKLPPIYPVLVGSDEATEDVSLDRISVTQTNFEDAPVTLAAQATTSGYRGRNLVAQLLDESGKPLQQQVAKVDEDGKPVTVRFQLRPEQSGVSFYRVRVAAEDQLAQFDDPAKLAEATLANNARVVAVDRGKGPYRVLYVTGRPNWEFKFLNRAVASDDQVKLVGLLRIARKEPKFTFLGRAGESSNPLFRGFDAPDKEQIESYDQPVIVRFNTDDAEELRGGFPQAAEDLYRYHAIILDDLESEFFTQDQMLLVKEFVRQRGGGLLMLGGQESFKNGKYDRTPIGDLLPVYADEVPAAPVAAGASGGLAKYRLELTREGLLEPWVRLRAEEDAERKRVAGMPAFQTLNQIRGIKPGATVLARAVFENGTPVPALVEQRFGAGRVGAMLIGDLWRWGLRRAPDAEQDLEKSWRQTIRWLVADVPQRVEVSLPPPDKSSDDQPEGAMTVSVNVRDPKYAPLDNAAVTVRVTGPDGNPAQLTAEPSAKKAGVYEATYVPRQGGIYRAEVIAAAPDGNEVARVETGWTSDPGAEEFRQLRPNRELLDRVARATGGQLIDSDKLSDVVATFPTRHAEITEPYIRPVWHQPLVFLLAILCLTAEWGLRRWKGLP